MSNADFASIHSQYNDIISILIMEDFRKIFFEEGYGEKHLQLLEKTWKSKIAGRDVEPLFGYCTRENILPKKSKTKLPPIKSPSNVRDKTKTKLTAVTELALLSRSYICKEGQVCNKTVPLKGKDMLCVDYSFESPSRHSDEINNDHSTTTLNKCRKKSVDTNEKCKTDVPKKRRGRPRKINDTKKRCREQSRPADNSKVHDATQKLTAVKEPQVFNKMVSLKGRDMPSLNNSFRISSCYNEISNGDSTTTLNKCREKPVHIKENKRRGRPRKVDVIKVNTEEIHKHHSRRANDSKNNSKVRDTTQQLTAANELALLSRRPKYKEHQVFNKTVSLKDKDMSRLTDSFTIPSCRSDEIGNAYSTTTSNECREKPVDINKNLMIAGLNKQKEHPRKHIIIKTNTEETRKHHFKTTDNSKIIKSKEIVSYKVCKEQGVLDKHMQSTNKCLQTQPTTASRPMNKTKYSKQLPDENVIRKRNQPAKLMHNNKLQPTAAAVTNNKNEALSKMTTNLKIILPGRPDATMQERSCEVQVPVIYKKKIIRSVLAPIIHKMRELPVTHAQFVIQEYIKNNYPNLNLIQCDGPSNGATFHLSPKFTGIPVTTTKKRLGEMEIDSDDDPTDEEDMSKAFECENTVICQYIQVKRSPNKWKIVLQNGVMRLNGKDHIFKVAKGAIQWTW